MKISRKLFLRKSSHLLASGVFVSPFFNCVIRTMLQEACIMFLVSIKNIWLNVNNRMSNHPHN